MRDFQKPGRSTVQAMNGMCATSHPLAAQVGVDLLRAGGTAADACVGMAFVLGLAEPMMCGLGGDMFALVKPAGEDRIVALNGSGRAPAALDAEALRAKGSVVRPLGADAVTVPGGVDGLCRLANDWGRLGLPALVAPAIDYAESGIPVAPRTAHDWAGDEAALTGDARRFYLSGGAPLSVGQVFRRPEEAEVLRAIARGGRDGFYLGAVAEDMVASLRAAGGCHTAEDFAATACNYCDPVSGTYKGIELVEHPPNGQGATAILLANILACFDIASLDPFGAERAHLEAEATKLAYDARDRFLADADHAARVAHMLAPDTGRALAALIDPGRVIDKARTLSETVHKETVYITAIDRDGMAVSLIYSIFNGFGSGLASARYGILMHNRGAGFTLERGHPNEAGPGKRPMHTIIPAMLRQDGRLLQSYGVMGGAYQATGHARVLSNQVDFGMDPQEALDAPRCFAERGVLRIERGYSDAVCAALADLGHRLEPSARPIGGGQIIRLDHANGVLVGASDPRKDGIALGY